MTDPLIPTATKTAAKRAFIRTAAQALASALPIGAITIGTTGSFWTALALATTGTIASAILAGLAAALMILAKGIPDDYADATLVKLSTLNTDEQAADINAAHGRTTLHHNLRNPTT